MLLDQTPNQNLEILNESEIPKMKNSNPWMSEPGVSSIEHSDFEQKRVTVNKREYGAGFKHRYMTISTDEHRSVGARHLQLRDSSVTLTARSVPSVTGIQLPGMVIVLLTR
jgi:hypothetical protein